MWLFWLSAAACRLMILPLTPFTFAYSILIWLWFSFFLFSCFFFFLLLFFIVCLGAVFCCFWVAGRILAFPVNWATAPILVAVLSAGAGDWALVPWFCFGSPVGKAAFVSVFAVSTGIVYAFSFVSGFCFFVDVGCVQSC